MKAIGTIVLLNLTLILPVIAFASPKKIDNRNKIHPTSTASPAQMHPDVEPLNTIRQNALYTQTPIDPNATCGNCHDTAYILTHNSHWHHNVKVSCFDCHVTNMKTWNKENQNIQGNIPSAVAGISKASTQACAKCHGVINNDTLSIPSDYEYRIRQQNGIDLTYDITRTTGAFFSGNVLSKSELNIVKKKSLNFPADVHAQRQLQCPDCHYNQNNPAKAETKRNKQSHLVKDPRTIGVSDYLYQPNHQFAHPHCTDCHNPTAAHDFLPYKERHLSVLDCQSCHVPQMFGPALAVIDETVMSPDGTPHLEYVEQNDRSKPINTRLIQGFPPSLLPYVNEKGLSKLGAFNILARWYWVDGATGKQIPIDLLKKVYADKSGKSFSIDTLQLFDKNANGKLSTNEFYISSKAQKQKIVTWLKQLGVTSPQIHGEVEAYPITHGITKGPNVISRCESCHEEEGRLTANVSISSRLPGGIVPNQGTRLSQLTHGKLLTDVDKLQWKREKITEPFYIFGHSRASWSDLLGFLLFTTSLLAVAAHGGYRLYTKKKRPSAVISTKRVYLYPLYERVWHWLMAISVVILMFTGWKVHFPLTLSFVSFEIAVLIHNITAIVLVVNAALSLFFHVASTAIVQFIPAKVGLLSALTKQVKYYTRGIFLGHPHPTTKTQSRKLNPLQQLTYLGLLNVLFPLQILSGVAIWINAKWPNWLEPIGGLSVIGPLHNLGAWLFLTFLIVHLYLTTTGHTVLSNLSAMIDGYDEIDDLASEGGTHE